MGLTAMCLEQSGQTSSGEVGVGGWGEWSGHCPRSGRLRPWQCCVMEAGLAWG